MKKQVLEERDRVAGEDPRKGGVKTPEGKEISKYNALKHGILSNVLTDYDRDGFGELHKRLLEEFRPKSTIEALLVERIALYQIRLERAAKAETQKINICLRSERFPDFGVYLGENGKEDTAPRLESGEIEILEGIYLRYEKTLENRLYRALHELERIQRARGGENIPAPLAIDGGEGEK
jgi:hypothetical protein